MPSHRGQRSRHPAPVLNPRTPAFLRLRQELWILARQMRSRAEVLDGALRALMEDASELERRAEGIMVRRQTSDRLCAGEPMPAPAAACRDGRSCC